MAGYSPWCCKELEMTKHACKSIIRQWWLSLPGTLNRQTQLPVHLILKQNKTKKTCFLLVFFSKIVLNLTFPHHFMHVTEINSLSSLNEEVLEIQMCTLLAKKSSLHTFSEYSFDSWCKKLSPHFWTFLLMSPSSMCYQPQTPPPPQCLALVAKVDVYTWSEGASNFASFCTEAAGTHWKELEHTWIEREVGRAPEKGE